MRRLTQERSACVAAKDFNDEILFIGNALVKICTNVLWRMD